MKIHANIKAYRVAMPDPVLRKIWRNRWYNMMHRCYDTTARKYKDYGGRGIRVVDRWHDVLAFLEDIQKLPRWDDVVKTRLEIDRRDNDGWYGPDNLQIVTREINNGHKRTTHHVSGDGLCASHFLRSEKLKAHKSSVLTWVKQGLSAQQIREKDRECTSRTGNLHEKNFIEHKGEMISARTFMRREDLNIGTWALYNWLAKGLSAEEICTRARQKCVQCNAYDKGYKIEHKGELYCTIHLKELLNISCSTMSILNWMRRGWNTDEMVAQDKKVIAGAGNSRAYIFFNYKGEKVCPSELCDKAKLFVPFTTVARWHREGYNLEQILEFDELRRQGKYRPR